MTRQDERMRILKMVELGQVTAEDGMRLLEAVGEQTEPNQSRQQARSLRVRVTDLQSQRQKINVTIPASLINVGLKLGARLAPSNGNAAIDAILHAVEAGTVGRVYEMQDLEEGERVEIFVE